MKEKIFVSSGVFRKSKHESSRIFRLLNIDDFFIIKSKSSGSSWKSKTD